MVQKRPFEAEEILEVSFKRPKHAGPINQLVSLSEPIFPDDDCHTHMAKTSEGWCTQGSSEGNDKYAGEIYGELCRGAGDSETSFPVGIPVSTWATSSTVEEDLRSEPPEPPVHLALYPEYLSPERPIRTLTRYEDIYSILLEDSPRKLVSVGSNHQADVPAWDFSGASIRPNAYEVEERLMGTCVIPMPHMELSGDDNEEVGKGRTDCSCEDGGSVRCVRQHIVEEREKLIKTFGPEKFTKLGFADMGEQVAEKWSLADEQLFHEVVFNNPASIDKNFWSYLSIVFPSLTKREIVSYYFNVFMLRRRGEQNRNDLLNIDSDNDEWEGIDGNEIATREEDEEDSLSESPVCQDDTCINNCHNNDLQDYDEYVADEICAANGTVDITERNIDDDSKYDTVEMHHSSGSPSPIQPQDVCDEKVNDSCTSANTGVTSRETKVKTENGDHWCGNYNEVSNGYSQGYVFEPSDAKVWDSGFVSCSKNKIDFLPTCNMIEEVFGVGPRQDVRRA
ncbi:uncharacterized protein LOC133303059 [Gastrolobium bilobum]|uniref:uncharacterized protein LOC133303059 n=1 Tax=Gastrolobium bilobum TaxID=150636 RepID=UPI002AAFBDFE|nr:uncharacterized protein LOC133303059 [Gastrolobium bilobum]